jgi:hypothetical protein
VSARVPRPFAVLGFNSTHDALDAEALLAQMGVEVVPIPAPKSIGSLCGIALRIPPEQVDRAEEYLVRGGIEVAARAKMEDV